MHYRPEIDGLRALAVVPVILFHADFEPFSGGYIGVDVFFVISGYLITGILLADLQKGVFSIANFYERRARRILPALVLVITACIPFAWVLMLPRDFLDFSQSALTATLFSSNILFWLESDYFDTAAELKPLLHTWSLGIEEQFYLGYPILLAITWRFARRYLGLLIIAGFVVSLALAQYLSGRSPDANFYLLPPRGWELLTGAYLAYREATNSGASGNRVSAFVDSPRFASFMSTLGMLAILAAVFLFDASTPHPSLITLLPVIGTALIIRFGEAPGVTNSILSQRQIVGIGLISYSLYLWHQPVFVFARFMSLHELGTAALLGLSLLSFALAILSYRYVESPFRDRKRTSRNAIWAFSAASATCLVAFAMVGIVTAGLPGRIPPEQLSVAETRVQIGYGWHFVDGRPCSNRDIDDSCILGDPRAEPSWALIGDSHASMLAPSLDASLAERGQSAKQMTYMGCAYALGLVRGDMQRDDCFDRNYAVRDALLESDIENILVIGRYVLYLAGKGFDNGEGGIELGDDGTLDPPGRSSEAERRAAVMKSYRDSIVELLDAGKTVHLVYPVPEIGWDVPRFWFKRARVGISEPITVSAERYFERARDVIELFDSLGQRSNLVRVYPDRILCDTVWEGRCTTEIDGVVLYEDDDHLNRPGSDMLVARILQGDPKMAEDQAAE